MKIGAQVKKIVVAAVAVLTLSHASHAEERHALHGLFCNAEAQLEQTLGHLRLGLSPQLAAEATNGRSVVCVHADRIRYVVIRPIILGQVRHRGTLLMKYSATLVGVDVGRNVRPVEPDLPIFFLSGDRIPGAVLSGNA
jgi:hypothetical protein